MANVKTRKPRTVLEAMESKDMVEETDRLLVPDDVHEKSRGLLGHVMSGSAFLSMLKADTVLRLAQRMFLETGKVEVPVTKESMMYSCYCMQRNRGDFSERILSATVDYLSEHPPELPAAVYNWVPKHKYERMTREALAGLWQDAGQTGPGWIVPTVIVSGFKRLRVALDKAVEEGRLHIHVGHAGTGKSTAVARVLNSRKDGPSATVVSLSNTIGLMFKQRVRGICNLSCNAASARLQEDSSGKGLTDLDYLVMDEFSQWGFEWLWLLVKLLERNPTAQLHVMGDTDQIPTFLCSGNLLYAMTARYPQCVEQYDKQYRFHGDYLSMMGSLVGKHVLEPGKFLVTTPDYKDYDCVITGTNAHVAMLNRSMLKAKTGIDFAENGKLSSVVDIGTALVCSETRKVGKDKAAQVPVYRNEKFLVVHADIPRKEWILASVVDGREVHVGGMDLDRSFELGYAMTVNRAQGLEWDRVLVYMDYSDRNMMSFSPLYVALSRGRESASLYLDGLSLASVNWYLKRNNEYVDHFRCTENDNGRQGGTNA